MIKRLTTWQVQAGLDEARSAGVCTESLCTGPEW